MRWPKPTRTQQQPTTTNSSQTNEEEEEKNINQKPAIVLLRCTTCIRHNKKEQNMCPYRMNIHDEHADTRAHTHTQPHVQETKAKAQNEKY